MAPQLAPQLAPRPPHRRPSERSPGQLPPHRVRPHALAQLLRSDGDPHGAPDGDTDGPLDWSPWYLTDEEDMGQSGEQGQLITLLCNSLNTWAREREWSATLVASDQFFAWVEGEPFVQVSPDIFLLDDPVFTADNRFPGRWEVWRPGQAPPRFAVEIVSADWKKDYQINPDRYDHLGVDELVLIDADAVVRDLADRGRYPFTVYRRTDADRLKQAYRGPGPAYCAQLDAYLCFQLVEDEMAPGSPRVRLCRDAEGRDIVLTGDEMSVVKDELIADKDAELAALAADNADKDVELAALAADNEDKDAELAALAADNADKDARLAAQEAELAALRALMRGDTES